MVGRWVWSVALSGIDGFPVEVEAAKGGGLPRVQLVGLPDASLSEAKARVRSAVLASGLSWPPGLVTINLVQDDDRTAEVAELDAALLTDDLPPEAYADPGFLQYLKSSKGAQGSVTR